MAKRVIVVLSAIGVVAAATAAAQSPLVSMPQIDRPAGQTLNVPAAGPSAPRRSDTTAAQVGASARTATSSPALSTTAQGRAVGVTALTGSDRCEPGSALADTDICRQRIETRAGQYTAPGAAPVTAEGRLLVLTEPTTLNPAEAVRRLGETPNLQSMVGDAANQVSAVLDQQRMQTNTPDAATASARAAGGANPMAGQSGLAGLPPTVVINPGR